MRIAFLTGSLEPAKDGVGDYTRDLATTCVTLGASCCTIALADRHVDQPQRDRVAGVDVLRLPQSAPWRKRRDSARALLRSWAPDYTSLQFVPYSFDRHGLPVAFVTGLTDLVPSGRLHVMFHEIWTGDGGPWPRRLVGAGQRWCVLRIARWPGVRIHTSNRTYQGLLQQRRVTATVLPLFGSIPLDDASDIAWLLPMLGAAGCDTFVDRRAEWWLCVLFGALHPIWPPEPLLERLQAAAASAGRRVALVSAGGIGSGAPLWQRMQERYGDRMPMLRVGEQPGERISALLNRADFGIATTPYCLLDKSASVAAMLEHGLPVIANRNDGPNLPDSQPPVLQPDRIVRLDETFERHITSIRRRPPASRLTAVARQFLADLSAPVAARHPLVCDAAAQPSDW